MSNLAILSNDDQQSDKSVFIYRSEDGSIQLEVQLVDDNVWLTQNQMTILFETTKQNISLHINNAFKEGELVRDSVVKDFLTTATDGENYHAKNEIILIDNYVDDSVLKILNKREDNISATIYTAHISETLKLDLEKHNSQYQTINIEQFNKSHDRFMIIDNDVYHIGASLKDLGKRMFAFSKMEIGKEIILSIL